MSGTGSCILVVHDTSDHNLITYGKKNLLLSNATFLFRVKED